jgi:acetolactate synthase-1/2/3 large subunit
MAHSDAVLAVGTRLMIRNFEADRLPNLVQIDIDPGEIGKNFPAEVGIEADAREALAGLVRALRGAGPARGSRADEIAAWRRAFRAKVRELAPRQLDMMATLRAELNEDAVVVGGITNLGYWSTIAYPVNAPRRFLTSSYFGTLGYAFPTALGAKVARPDRQVVALCGDGGFMYSTEELSTAMRHGIGVIAIVFNNHAYGASRWDQTHRFGGRFIGTDLHNPDFMKLAEAYGVTGLRCDPASLGQTLRKALSVKAPVLLEVEVPIMMPPFQIV